MKIVKNCLIKKVQKKLFFFQTKTTCNNKKPNTQLALTIFIQGIQYNNVISTFNSNKYC